MVRILLSLVVVSTLMGCETFRDYTVSIKDPTAKPPAQEAPYYDYTRKTTVYTD